jgi:hypothetical protein
MTQMTTNGRPRKRLAEQIDRLEQTVGGLGQTVREATTQAVREAVGELVSEVLTNPEVATLLRGAQPQPREVSSSSPGRIRSG